MADNNGKLNSQIQPNHTNRQGDFSGGNLANDPGDWTDVGPVEIVRQIVVNNPKLEQKDDLRFDGNSAAD